MARPWLTEREIDVLRAIHRGDVTPIHSRHRWGYLRRNVGSVTAIVERLYEKEAIEITTKAGGTPVITISLEAEPLV